MPISDYMITCLSSWFFKRMPYWNSMFLVIFAVVKMVNRDSFTGYWVFFNDRIKIRRLAPLQSEVPAAGQSGRQRGPPSWSTVWTTCWHCLTQWPCPASPGRSPGWDGNSGAAASGQRPWHQWGGASRGPPAPAPWISTAFLEGDVFAWVHCRYGCCKAQYIKLVWMSRYNTPDWRNSPISLVLARISIWLEGSEPCDRKQTRGVLLSDSSHVDSRSRMALSEYCSPSESEMFVRNLGSVHEIEIAK